MFRFAVTCTFALSSPAFDASLLFWDFKNVARNGSISRSEALLFDPAVNGKASQTGEGPAQVFQTPTTGVVHLTRLLGMYHAYFEVMTTSRGRGQGNVFREIDLPDAADASAAKQRRVVS